jgi:hypothetical protein
VPEAETPKEHLRAIDKDHQVHHFQITSQIATAFAVRESVLAAIFDDDVHFCAGSTCIYKTRTISIGKDFFGPTLVYARTPAEKRVVPFSVGLETNSRKARTVAKRWTVKGGFFRLVESSTTKDKKQSTEII